MYSSPANITCFLPCAMMHRAASCSACTGSARGNARVSEDRHLAGRHRESILYAIEQPADVDVSEIIIRPTASPY
jgi:NADP-dependent 3-hydroxy acid dehydrogenase YdfG